MKQNDIDLDKEPWLANDEWRNKRINEHAVVRQKISLPVMLFAITTLGGLYLLFSFAIVTSTLEKGITIGNLVLPLVFVFAPIVGFVVVIYFRLQKRKFGTSVCHLLTLPAFIGGTLEVDVEIEFPIRAMQSKPFTVT